MGVVCDGVGVENAWFAGWRILIIIYDAGDCSVVCQSSFFAVNHSLQSFMSRIL